MVSTYLTVTILVCLLAYAGIDNTISLFAYLDLELRWHWIIFKTYFMRRQLESELGLPKTPFTKHYKTYGRQ